MHLAHMGMAISHVEDVQTFYTDLLGMNVQYEFQIPAAQMKDIFNVVYDVRVFMLKKHEIVLELFYAGETPVTAPPLFGHLCFFSNDRATLAGQARQLGYRVDVFSRPQGDLIFIFDKSGNRFEVKQAEM